MLTDESNAPKTKHSKRTLLSLGPRLLLRGLKEELDTGSRVKSIGKIRPDFTPKVDLEAGKMSLSMRQPGLPGDEASELQSPGSGVYPAYPLFNTFTRAFVLGLPHGLG